MPPKSTAVEKASAAVAAKPPVKSLTDLIRESVKELQTALPAHMNAENLARIALTTIRLNPKLTECTPASFLGALFQSAHLGLNPNINGEAWIIPYRNSKKSGEGWIKVMEAQFQVGAYGWVKLFYNHQNSVTLQMESVHRNDNFSFDLGTSTVHHSPPSFGEDRGEVIGYYAIATLANGGRVAKAMSKKEAFEHAKRFSKCWDAEKNDFMKGTPWKEHFDAMGQVTVLKQVMKLVPKSVEIQKALAMDQTTKTRLDADMLNVADETNWADAEVMESEKLPEGRKEDSKVVEEKKEPVKTGDPVVDKSSKVKEGLEGAIRTLKTTGSIEKLAGQIQEKANTGELIEQHRRDLMEMLELKQNQLLAGEKKETQKAEPAKEHEVAGNKSEGGFDPRTETIDFGKHNGKKWIDIPKSWLTWFEENTQNAEKKAKVQATLVAQGE